MRGRVVMSVAAACAFAACSGARDDAAPSSRPPGEEVGDAGSGAPDAGEERDTTPPDGGTSTRPDEIERCTVLGPAPVRPPLELFGRHDDAGRLFLYFVGGTTMGRFEVRSTAPCVLSRDPTFVADASPGWKTADDGSVWSPTVLGIRRSYPPPAVTCAIDGATESDVVVGFDMQDGKRGTVYLERGDADPELLRGDIVASSSGCAIDGLVPSAPPPAIFGSSARRDARGRFHVLPSKIADPIRIVDAADAVVASYFDPKVAPYRLAESITSCGGGMCILGSSAGVFGVFYVDADGNVRAEHAGRDVGLLAEAIGAAPTGGPTFIAGFTDPSKNPDSQLVIQIAPAPPP